MAIPRVLRPIVDFALPPRCAGCGVGVDEDDRLCAPCWGTLDFITDDGCDTCGAPVHAGVIRCARCLERLPDHDGVRAATTYGEISRHIVLRLKHGRRAGLARLMAAAMVRLLPEGTDTLVPVPLHRWRLWSRGFNQSLLIARQLHARAGIPVEAELLVRTKRTPLLRGLAARDRAKAVRGAFSISDRSRVQGRDFVLVDDVYTSGATANACARALKRAGASRVTVLCWARVPFGEAD